MDPFTPELLTVQEVAEYLRLKERKVYDLVAQRQIPCTRISGKWLFPRTQIDLWLKQHSEYHMSEPAIATPAVLVGSHDPLLEWAIREAGFPFAIQAAGSLPGLNRFADGGAALCGIHLFDPTSGEYNLPAVRELLKIDGYVVLEWAWRRQGLVLAAGNPLGIRLLPDLVRTGARVAQRQIGAGSQVLQLYLLAQAGIQPEQLNLLPTPAHSETDIGLAVLEGQADAGLAIEATARQLKLDFLPLTRERYDLVIRRRDYFEPPFQQLLRYTRTPTFAEKAAALGGYDVGGSGTVRYNSP